MADAFNRLQGARSALGVKAPVRAATTADVTLSGFQTIDGVTFASGDEGDDKNTRVLVKDQDDASENGIYVVSSGDWARAKDFDGNTDFIKGTIVYVANGSVNSGTLWAVNSDDPPSVGTNDITFAETEFTAAQSLATGALDAIAEIASSLRTGSDSKLVTGTAGSENQHTIWNSDGDLVASVASDSYVRRRVVQMVVFNFVENVTTGDGAYYFHVPNLLDEMDVVDVHAEVISAGTTGTLDIQIHNVTDGVDMLSTKLTIDSGETGSDTASTPAVIDTSNDDVAENDLIRVDIDSVQTTPPSGLVVTMEFKIPDA